MSGLAAVAGLVACAEDRGASVHTAAPGTLRMPLVTELDGIRYGLEATFDIAGPEALLLHTSRGDDALEQQLEPGAYVVTLSSDFQVFRLTANGDSELVAATLVSAATQAVQIESATTSRLSYRFSIGRADIGFGSGALEVEFRVEHPKCSGSLSLQRYSEAASLPAPGSVGQLIYAPLYSKLAVRNAASAIHVLDIDTGASVPHLANFQFVDMSLSPDGRFVFASDYGGEDIGYSTPANQSYVHRLDLADGSWEIKTAYIAGNIQATAADRFVLKTMDQWVTFYYDAWEGGAAVTNLSSLYGSVYFGDFRYDHRTARLLHGNSGLSSQEIRAFRLVNDGFVAQEGTGTYGSASGYGPSVALSTDGSAFYYGRLGVDALDVTHDIAVFPEAIYAAFGDTAFGSESYFDVRTTKAIGSLGFSTSVYGLNADGSDFWAYDAATETARHFTLTQCSQGQADAGGM